MLVSKRPFQNLILKDILGLIRTFPSGYIIVERAILVSTPGALGEQSKSFLRVWAGEALVKPGSGTIQRLEQGQINTDHPDIIIPGKIAIFSGDFVHLDGLLYQVTAVGDFFAAFVTLNMNLYQQQP